MPPLVRPARTLLIKLRALSPNCREAARLQSQALDHPLPFLPRLGVRLHRALCQRCRRYGDQILRLRELVQAHPDGGDATPSITLSPAARQRCERALREAAK